MHLLRTTIALSVLLFTNYSHSWSEIGHEAVCEIAYLELTPAAKSVVDRLIACAVRITINYAATGT
jgi:hypothetical protein